ncbi:MAG: FAD-dependent thymidylate synthase [Clostridiales bacterium]|jgi:thymidylate synthase ThyX|nr:FAD-dependent thymidylate synthase [Clostridiales bacterium]
MRIVSPEVIPLILPERKTMYTQIEIAARTCYKSEDKITENSAEKMIRSLVLRGHHAMIEHGPSISMKFVCDRGVSHEIVRHRLFSFAQESTRYVSSAESGASENIDEKSEKQGLQEAKELLSPIDTPEKALLLGFFQTSPGRPSPANWPYSLLIKLETGEQGALSSGETAQIWNDVPDEYKPTFARGLLDGSGSLDVASLGCDLADWLKRASDYNNDQGLGQLGALSELLLKDFKFPFGNPSNSAQLAAITGKEYPFSDVLSPKFAVVKPLWATARSVATWIWYESMIQAEENYAKLLRLGWKPQQARAVLPNSLKTEIVVTGNAREWRHFIELRTAKDAHPQMREVALMAYSILVSNYPVLFEDLKPGE